MTQRVEILNLQDTFYQKHPRSEGAAKQAEPALKNFESAQCEPPAIKSLVFP